MKDKEVGELWHDVNLVNGFWEQLPGAKEPMVELIRKLVEERADCLLCGDIASDRKLKPPKHYIYFALRDFCIPEETWMTRK